MIGDTHTPKSEPLILKRYQPQPQHLTLDTMRNCPICGYKHGITNCPVCHDYRESPRT